MDYTYAYAVQVLRTHLLRRTTLRNGNKKTQAPADAGACVVSCWLKKEGEPKKMASLKKQMLPSARRVATCRDCRRDVANECLMLKYVPQGCSRDRSRPYKWMEATSVYENQMHRTFGLNPFMGLSEFIRVCWGLNLYGEMMVAAGRCARGVKQAGVSDCLTRRLYNWG